jgi:hypothetical protein
MLLADYGEFPQYDYELWTSCREVRSKLLILPHCELSSALETVREIAEMSRVVYPLTVLVERGGYFTVSLLNDDWEFTEGFLSREVEDVEDRLEQA